MKRGADLRRRLDALSATIRPPNSLAARLGLLTPRERERYDKWKVDRTEWIDSFDEPGGAYADLCANVHAGPRLATRVAFKLFDPIPTIPAGATVEEAAEIYQRMVRNER